ncbi:MAG: hypothetical protein GY696_30860 [Gammaproteobacteria bacterium]|nr:hypothetical protein [Gammaproteobacteria bacterium]
MTNGGTSCFLRNTDQKNFNDGATACENAAYAAPDWRGRLAAVQSEVDWEAIKNVPGVTSSSDIWFGLMTPVHGKLTTDVQVKIESLMVSRAGKPVPVYGRNFSKI